MARLSREERIDLYGSENFTQEPAISSNDVYTFSPKATERIAKYMPCDELTIQNESNSNIALLFNGSSNRRYIIKAGTIRDFDKTDILPFRTYKLKELSGNAVNEGDVTVDVSRAGMDSDKQARKQAEQPAASKFVENIFGVTPQELMGNGRR